MKPIPITRYSLYTRALHLLGALNRMRHAHLEVSSGSPAPKYNQITNAALLTKSERIQSRRSCLIVLSVQSLDLFGFLMYPYRSEGGTGSTFSRSA